MAKKEARIEKFRSLDAFKKAFVNSKLNGRFWKVFLADILAVVLFLFIIFVALIYTTSGILKTVGEAGELLALSQNIQNNAVLSSALGKIFLFFMLSIILAVLISVFFKSLSWKIAVKKEFSWKYYFKYILLNIIFFVIFGVVLSAFFRNPFLIIIGVILGIVICNIYFLSLVNFAKSDNFGNSFKKGFYGWRLDKFFLVLVYFFILVLIFLLINKFIVFSGIYVPDFASMMQGGQSFQAAQELTSFLNAVFMRLFISILIWIFLASYVKIFYSEYVSDLS